MMELRGSEEGWRLRRDSEVKGEWGGGASAAGEGGSGVEEGWVDGWWCPWQDGGVKVKGGGVGEGEGETASTISDDTSHRQAPLLNLKNPCRHL